MLPILPIPVSLLEILIVLGLIFLILIIFAGGRRGKSQSSRQSFWKSLTRKPVTLTCWHCGQPTPADQPECVHCHQELV